MKNYRYEIRLHEEFITNSNETGVTNRGQFRELFNQERLSTSDTCGNFLYC